MEVEQLDQGKSGVEILNLQGQVIQSIPLRSGKNRIDVTKYASGVYFFRLNHTINKFIKI
jgi:hypothetical protein